MRDNRRNVEVGDRWILQFVNGVDWLAHDGSIALLVPVRQRKSRVQSVLNFGNRITMARSTGGRINGRFKTATASRLPQVLKDTMRTCLSAPMTGTGVFPEMFL